MLLEKEEEDGWRRRRRLAMGERKRRERGNAGKGSTKREIPPEGRMPVAHREEDSQSSTGRRGGRRRGTRLDEVMGKAGNLGLAFNLDLIPSNTVARVNFDLIKSHQIARTFLEP